MHIGSENETIKLVYLRSALKCHSLEGADVINKQHQMMDK